MNYLRVLLVCSDANKSERISSDLANAGHMVLQNPSLEEACEALYVEQFDAVLLGSAFTAASLSEFCSRLRRLESNQKTSARMPVLGLESIRNIGILSAENCDGFLEEPVNPIELTNTLKNLAQAIARPLEREAAAATNSLPVLEPEKFEEQVGFDTELMVEIIDLFLVETNNTHVPEMKSFAASADWDSLSKTAHTIKGSLASLHATKARTRAQELESAAREGRGSECLGLSVELLKDLKELEPYLHDLRGAVSAAA